MKWKDKEANVANMDRNRINFFTGMMQDCQPICTKFSQHTFSLRSNHLKNNLHSSPPYVSFFRNQPRENSWAKTLLCPGIDPSAYFKRHSVRSASQPWRFWSSINLWVLLKKTQSGDDGWAISHREVKWQVTKKRTHRDTHARAPL